MTGGDDVGDGDDDGGGYGDDGDGDDGDCLKFQHEVGWRRFSGYLEQIFGKLRFHSVGNIRGGRRGGPVHLIKHLPRHFSNK